MEQVAIDAIEEIAKVVDLLLGQLTATQSLVDARRDQVVMRGRRHGSTPSVLGVSDEERGTCILIVNKPSGHGRGYSLSTLIILGSV